MRLRQTNIWLLLVALAVPLKLQAVVFAHSLPDSTFYAKYQYICFVELSEKVEITDEDFYRHAAKLAFAVNKSEPQADDPLLTELEREVLPRVNADSLELVCMMVRGAASPEGPTEINRRLGERRCRALYDFINARMNFRAREGNFRLSSDIEDYRSLCRLMQEAGDRDYQTVRTLCDSYLQKGQPELLKMHLQTVQDGRLWSRLLAQYFPQLRAARVMLFFRKHRQEEVSVAKIDEIKPVAAPDTLSATPAPIEVEPLVTVPEEPAAPPAAPAQPAPDCCSELLAVKTNMLFYGIYMPGYDRWCPIPNIAVEYYPRGSHFTVGASFDMPWWQDYWAHKYFQARHYQVEARYYPRLKSQHSSGAAGAYGAQTTGPRCLHSLHEGLYWQVYANGGIYGICFDADRGWVGEGIGCGVGVGYVTPLSRKHRWRLELGLQAGFFTTKYDPFQYENPVDPTYTDHLYYYKWTLDPALFKKRLYRRTWVGPTRIGVTLSYNILYRRERNKAYKPYEPYEAQKPYKAHEPQEPPQKGGVL